MNDLISRKAAVEAIWNSYGSASAVKNIENLPSAQSTMGQVFDGDTISRAAAIDACIRVREYRAYDEIEEIKALPSAQSERQKGEWIDYTEDGYVECPFCHSATNCDGNKDELHFCFSCGADMRGKQDG